MDDEWTPPTEEEMKVIEARRARSDQISKLMASYLLKGHKMLGTNCSTCGTILLQDRSDTKHCIACEELDCDTVKDDPALRPPIQSLKVEPKAPAASKNTTMTASATCFPHPASTSPRMAVCSPRALVFAPTEEGTEYLSMSSIDVHCWPANPTDLTGMSHGAGGDEPTGTPRKADQCIVQDSSTQRAAEVSTPSSKPIATQVSSEDLSTCIHKLQRKIIWASQALEQSSNVDSSTSLCKLIKEAAEAIVAVRKASL